MKKRVWLSLLLAVCVLPLASCGNEETVHEISDFDSESRITVEENSFADISSEPITGDVVVKDKKYTYKETDLVILEVENQTNRDYSITVNGTYLDKNGKTLKTESQTFDQYYSGYKNYFVFRPEIKFDKFTYTLEFGAMAEINYIKHVAFEFQGLSEFTHVVDELYAQGDYTQYPGIMGQYAYQYSGDVRVLLTVDWVLFNEQGEIIHIAKRGDWLLPGQNFDSYDNDWVYHPVTDHFEWPESMKGNITAITAVQRIATAIQ